MSEEFLAVERPDKLALFTAVALAAITFSASGFSADATATATATVVTPVAISNAANLSFGNFDASTTGTITVDTAGVRTASGVKLSGGSPTAAAFTVTAQSGLSYNITYTGTSPTLRNGADTLGFALVSDLGGAATGSGTAADNGIVGAGTTTLRVGGILTVSSARKTAGTYTGTIAAAVHYQ
jgi:spore coat protein U-like protein